jgi:hypothetical protein
LNEALGDHGQAVRAPVLQRLLGEVEGDLRIVVPPQPDVALDQMGVGQLAMAIDLQRPLEKLDRPLERAQPVGHDPGRQQRIQLPRHQVHRPLEARHGLSVTFGGFQGQAEVEVPLGLIRVQRNCLAELRLGLGPATPLVHLQGPVSMLLRVEPVAHLGPSPRVGSFIWTTGYE